MQDAPRRVELFVRSLQPNGAAERQAAIIDRLDRLEEAEAIEGYELTVWGRQVSRESPAADTETGSYVLSQIDAFREWAADAGVSLDSAFETRVVENDLVGESYAATVLPVALLAERVDGELRFVAPHDRKDGVYSIDDRLAQLEAEAGLAPEGVDSQPSAIAD